MSAARLFDWRERLCALVDARRLTPFAWGASDCCLWAADAIAAMTGRDLAAALRGRYFTRFGAARRLLELGYRSVRELVAETQSPIARPQLGDLVIDPRPPLDALMIAAGRGSAWGQGPHGVERVPLPPRCEFWAV